MNGDSRVTAPLLASLIIPSTARSATDIPRFTIPSGTGRVELNFNIGADTDFSAYRVVVEAQGSVVARTKVKSHVVNRFPVVSVMLPVRFTGEQYLQASVFGLTAQSDELLEAYSFILVRGVRR
jgi:hypothetical protein